MMKKKMDVKAPLESNLLKINEQSKNTDYFDNNMAFLNENGIL